MFYIITIKGEKWKTLKNKASVKKELARLRVSLKKGATYGLEIYSVNGLVASISYNVK